MRILQTDDIIRQWLESNPGWDREGDLLTKGFVFDSFVAAIEFVRRVADLAEEKDHHPDIDIRYDRVRIGLTTHSAGGITEMDLELAARIDRTASG